MTRRRNSDRAGFTLIEMMVALVAGAMAITSIYFVSASSSHHFQEQQRIAQTQMSIRLAMEQIRSDFSRAGYLGSPNSDVERRCVAPAQRIQAIDLDNNANFADLTASGSNPFIEADRVRLVGNYATGDSYLAIGMNASGDTIFFQTSWQGFRRSFGVPGLDYDSALFDQVFAVGRWVHLTTQDNNHFFAQIAAVDGSASPPFVTINTNWPVGSPCLQIGSGATVSPLMRIEYVVVPAATASMAALASASALAGADGPTLVRREQLITTGAAVANSERIVAEYVADFDVDLIVNTAAVGLTPVFSRPATDAAGDVLLGVTPHQARSAIVRLSIRTALEDEKFEFGTPRGAAADPLTRYELTAAPGAARVRTEAAEIVLPNVALRGL